MQQRAWFEERGDPVVDRPCCFDDDNCIAGGQATRTEAKKQLSRQKRLEQVSSDLSACVLFFEKEEICRRRQSTTLLILPSHSNLEPHP